MRSIYVPMGLALSCLLVLAAPRFTNESGAARGLATVTAPVATIAQQLAQDDSNDSNTAQEPYQPGDDSNAGSDNPDQSNPQAGDGNEGDSSQANPPGDSGDGAQQMNPNPDSSDSDNADQSNQGSDNAQ